MIPGDRDDFLLLILATFDVVDHKSWADAKRLIKSYAEQKVPALLCCNLGVRHDMVRTVNNWCEKMRDFDHPGDMHVQFVISEPLLGPFQRFAMLWDSFFSKVCASLHEAFGAGPDQIFVIFVDGNVTSFSHDLSVAHEVVSEMRKGGDDEITGRAVFDVSHAVLTSEFSAPFGPPQCLHNPLWVQTWADLHRIIAPATLFEAFLHHIPTSLLSQSAAESAFVHFTLREAGFIFKPIMTNYSRGLMTRPATIGEFAEMQEFAGLRSDTEIERTTQLFRIVDTFICINSQGRLNALFMSLKAHMNVFTTRESDMLSCIIHLGRKRATQYMGKGYQFVNASAFVRFAQNEQRVQQEGTTKSQAEPTAPFVPHQQPAISV